ncbi:DUF1127 domain-containing protein [Acidocella sp.]|jgi:uncharacterized protein YjiS (DUF1127 family)|uniref:DUF1127 domain-containing protein n=1 Tax=Acidocella sp. TaxID=50710 RepID=UPI002F418D66
MSSNISNPSSLSKHGEQLSARQVPQNGAVWLKSLLDGFRAWRAARAAEAELYAFSDRELADIGLNRHSIHAAVRGVARR